MDKVELSPDNRRAKVIDLLGLYAGHSAVPVLGDGIVQHIGKVFRAGETWPSSDNLDQWVFAWGQAAGSIDEFRLPLRLLRTGVEFVKSGGKDTAILLDLASTERRILRQAFGLPEEDSRTSA